MQRCNDPDEIKSNIASSALRTPCTLFDDKNVFAIYVSYYVKVKLTLSGMGGELSLKLPFTLAHFDDGLGSPTTKDLSKQSSIQSRDKLDETTRETTRTETAMQNKKSLMMEKSLSCNTSTNNNCSYPSTSTTSSSSSSRVTDERATMAGKGQGSCDANDKPRIDIENHPEGEPTINLSMLRQRRFSQVRQERIRPEDDSSLDRIETLSDDEEVQEFRTATGGIVRENGGERDIMRKQDEQQQKPTQEESLSGVLADLGHARPLTKVDSEDERKQRKGNEASVSTCTTLVQIHGPKS